VDSVDLVVTGSVQTVEDDGDVHFAIDRYFKGEGPPVILVVNPDNESDLTDCSVGAYVSGGDQPQFLQRVSGGYATGYCLGDGALTQDQKQNALEEVIAYTGGEGAAPGAATARTGDGSNTAAYVIIAGALGLSLAGVAGWSFLKSRRKSE
jgi:hypothetical protein